MPMQQPQTQAESHEQTPLADDEHYSDDPELDAESATEHAHASDTAEQTRTDESDAESGSWPQGVSVMGSLRRQAGELLADVSMEFMQATSAQRVRAQARDRDVPALVAGAHELVWLTGALEMISAGLADLRRAGQALDPNEVSLRDAAGCTDDVGVTGAVTGTGTTAAADEVINSEGNAPYDEDSAWTSVAAAPPGNEQSAPLVPHAPVDVPLYVRLGLDAETNQRCRHVANGVKTRMRARSSVTQITEGLLRIEAGQDPKHIADALDVSAATVRRWSTTATEIDNEGATQ